jgi:AcrR family transcriptional regulator
MRVKTDERRKAIIEAATKVFREKGYARASMDVIARKVGGSKATLYGYFKSKDELFEAAMAEVVESAVHRIRPLLDVESDDLQGVLERAAEAYVAFIVSEEILPITRVIVGEGFKRDVGPALFEQGPRRGLTVMAEFFAAQIGRGRLRDADPLTVALHFKGLIETDKLEAALYGAKASREGRGAVVDAVAVFLAAYRAEDVIWL